MLLLHSQLLLLDPGLFPATLLLLLLLLSNQSLPKLSPLLLPLLLLLLLLRRPVLSPRPPLPLLPKPVQGNGRTPWLPASSSIDNSC
jgi:hypothetical protein